MLRAQKGMSTDDSATVKSVANGDSIEVEIPREAIQQVADEYGLSYDEALRDVLQTGIDEKLAIIEMLREEAETYRDDDGRHVVSPFAVIEEGEG